MEDIGSGKEKIGERGVRGKERGENSRGTGKVWGDGLSGWRMEESLRTQWGIVDAVVCGEGKRGGAGSEWALWVEAGVEQ